MRKLFINEKIQIIIPKKRIQFIKIKDGKENITESDLKKLKEIFKVFAADILGFISVKESSGSDLTNEVMELVLKLRRNAKSTKDFTTADLIRDELNKLNIQVNDSRDGSSWELNK